MLFPCWGRTALFLTTYRNSFARAEQPNLHFNRAAAAYRYTVYLCKSILTHCSVLIPTYSIFPDFPPLRRREVICTVNYSVLHIQTEHVHYMYITCTLHVHYRYMYMYVHCTVHVQYITVNYTSTCTCTDCTYNVCKLTVHIRVQFSINYCAIGYRYSSNLTVYQLWILNQFICWGGGTGPPGPPMDRLCSNPTGSKS